MVERPPSAETGHDGRPITTTVDLLRDEEGDDAAENPSAGSFGTAVFSSRLSLGCRNALSLSLSLSLSFLSAKDSLYSV